MKSWRIEVNGNVEVFEGRLSGEGQKGRGRGPVCRKDSGLRRNGLTSQAFVVNALTAAKHTEGSGQGLRRGTNHALTCTGLHVVNATQGLEGD